MFCIFPNVSLLFQMTISQLKAELEKGPQEVAVYTKEIHELKSSLNSLQQQSQVRQNTTKHTLVFKWVRYTYTHVHIKLRVKCNLFPL